MTLPDRDRRRKSRRKRKDEQEEPAAAPPRRKRPIRMRDGLDLEQLAAAMSNSELQRVLAEETTEEKIAADKPAPLIPQPTEQSGWAAYTAMLVSRRENRALTPRDVAMAADLTLTDTYSWSDIARAISTWGLRTTPPAIWTPQPWGDLLSRLGPLWIIQPEDPSCAALMISMHGDGSPEGTMVTLLTPGPPDLGMSEQITFQEFSERYGAGEGNPEVVHA